MSVHCLIADEQATDSTREDKQASKQMVKFCGRGDGEWVYISGTGGEDVKALLCNCTWQFWCFSVI